MRSVRSSLTLSSQQYITSLSVPILTAYYAIKCPAVFYVMGICTSGLPLFKYCNEVIENRWWIFDSQKKKVSYKCRIQQQVLNISKIFIYHWICAIWDAGGVIQQNSRMIKLQVKVIPRSHLCNWNEFRENVWL